MSLQEIEGFTNRSLLFSTVVIQMKVNSVFSLAAGIFCVLSFNRSSQFLSTYCRVLLRLLLINWGGGALGSEATLPRS